MNKFLFTTSLALCIAASPAHAQLLGGGFGGGLGGGLGGMNMPGGMLNGAGDIGIERATRSVSATANASQTVRAPRIHRGLPTADVAANAGAATQLTTRAAQENANLGTAAGTTGHNVQWGTRIEGGSTVPRGAAVPWRQLPRLAVAVIPVAELPELPNVEIRSAAIAVGGIAPIAVGDVPGYVQNEYVQFDDELRGTGATVRRHGDQIIIDMPADVTFAFDRSNIQPRFVPALDALSRTLNRYPATFIDVEGHTDAIGSLSYNQALSERRADSVAGFLAGRAVLSGRMHTDGFGKTQPIASNATIDGRAANRRVEIVLTPYAG